MKKTLIAFVGLIVLVSASAFATETRTLVMGQNSMIMVDDFNMFMYPGRVNNYPNLLLGEFSQGPNFYQTGITWQFNDENPWVLGTFVSYYPEFGAHDYDGRDLSQFGQAFSTFPNQWLYNYPWWWWYDFGYEDRAPAAVNELSDSYPRRLHLIYGRKLGGQNFGFSAQAVKASWKAEDDSTQYVPVNTDAKQSFYQYTLGFGLTEASTGKWDLGLSFMFGGWTNENPEGEKFNEPSGYYDLMASGRYFWVRNPKVTLVPHASFGIGKRGAQNFGDLPDTTPDDDFKVEWTSTAFDLGCGMNYTPGANMLAVADLGFSYWKVKGESTGGTDIDPEFLGEHSESYFIFPYLKLGFEGEVFNWMDVRAGGYTYLWSSSFKIESDFMVDQTYNEPSSDTYLGLGFHWGRLYLDTYMDPEIVLDGFNFISGSNDADDLNFQVSMLYEMF
ncbi:MAG: hypothetical protein AB1772_01965 [Candidatus Zixiibacteriota bacterium]